MLARITVALARSVTGRRVGDLGPADDAKAVADEDVGFAAQGRDRPAAAPPRALSAGSRPTTASCRRKGPSAPCRSQVTGPAKAA